MRSGLIIELLENVVTSGSAATASTPKSLPYIPGAMLLGAAATKASSRGLDMSGELAFDAFFRGSTRFDDALPVSHSGEMALPVPMSVHRRKGSDEGLKTPNGNIADYSTAEREPGFEQLHSRYFFTDGTEHTVDRVSSLRTAIDPNTGHAAKGQLFGYEALKAGQFFVSTVSGVDEKSVSLAVSLLEGEHFLGRSRSAEFGRVRITKCEPWQVETGDAGCGLRYIWFLADFWAYDENGMPTIRPQAALFANKGRIAWNRSFIRTRRFAPYNSEWRKRAPERVLIQRGAVLTLKESNLSLGLHRFGLGQELGNGLALVLDKPPLMALTNMNQPKVKLPQSLTSRPAEETALSKWLELAAKRHGSKREMGSQIEDDAFDLMMLYENAERLAGEKVGPGASQWGHVRAGLLSGGKLESLITTRSWQVRFGVGDRATFQGYLRDHPNQRNEYLARLAKAMHTKLEQESWFDGT